MAGSSHLDLRSPSPPLATLAAEVAAAGGPPIDQPAILEAVKESFSIRLADGADATCTLCGESVGTGPIGFLDHEPVCDLCLLEDCKELGMVLALVAVVRAYASVEAESDREHQDALEELGVFARIYETVAAKSGPARRILPRLSIH